MLAVEVSQSDILTAAAGIGGGGGLAAVAKFLWNAWEAREKRQADERLAELRRLQDDRDAERKRLLADAESERNRLLADCERLRTEVSDLSKKLSAKSDAHAADVRALMDKTVEKVESWRGEDQKAARQAYEIVAANAQAMGSAAQELDTIRAALLVLQNQVANLTPRAPS